MAINISMKTIGYTFSILAIALFVVLVLIKISIDARDASLCDIFHEYDLDMQQCPAHKSNASWIILFAFGINLAIFVAAIYTIFFGNLPALKKEYKKIDASKLGKDEKTIYDIIKNKSGSAYQADLVKESGFGKVKVTRILDKLESMDVLERKRRGMTNIIVLK